MEILLITFRTKWMWIAIAIFLLMAGVSFLGWCAWSAKPYDFEGDPIDAPNEVQSITYDEIMDCEMPFIGNIYN